VDISFSVCLGFLFVCLFVCTVTDFSVQDKARRRQILDGGSLAYKAGNLTFL